MRHVTLAPDAVRVQETERTTELPPGTALVRVLACGVCRTDLELLRGAPLPPGVGYPIFPGHEAAGIVEDIAPSADGHTLSRGDLVVAHPIVVCGRCSSCDDGHDSLCAGAEIMGMHRAGGMADELVWPASRLLPVPDADPAQAALLADAVATGYHALTLADVPEGGRLALLGAGGLGTHTIQVARALDPTVTIAAVMRSPATAERVAAMGVHTHQGLETAARALRGELGAFDAVIDFSGAAEAPTEGLKMLRPGGRFVFGSVVNSSLDCGPSMRVVTRELKILGTTSSTLADLGAVADLLQSGALDMSGSITHRVPLSRAPDAFAMLASPPPGMVRVVVEPGAA